MFYIVALVDNVNTGIDEVEDGLDQAKYMIKDAISYQLECVSDATVALGEGLKKSITNCSKQAKRLSRSVSEFMDVEDLLKSIHKVTHSEEHAHGKSKIIHTPIDWSKYPASAFRHSSQDSLQFIGHQKEQDDDEDDNYPDEENEITCMKEFKESEQKNINSSLSSNLPIPHSKCIRSRSNPCNSYVTNFCKEKKISWKLGRRFSEPIDATYCKVQHFKGSNSKSNKLVNVAINTKKLYR